MKKYNLMFLNQNLPIISDEGDEYVDALHRYISATIDKFDSPDSHYPISILMKSLYACVSLTDELFKKQIELDITKKALAKSENKGDGAMTRQFVETHVFTKRWREMGLGDDDLLGLQNFILKNPKAGDIIQGAGGATKIRYALPRKGKSGGARVIYVDLVRKERVYLLLCYQKGKQDNLTDEQKKTIAQFIKDLKGE